MIQIIFLLSLMVFTGLVTPAFAQDSSEGGADTPVMAPALELEDPGPSPILEPQEQEVKGGLFGPFRVGPTIAIGFPHPLTYGIDFTWKDEFGAALTFGDFSLPEMSGVTVKVSNWDLRGRWFPWQDSFFLGAAYGSQTISAVAKKNITAAGQTVSTRLRLDIDTSYFTPHIGWLATWDVGFTFGFEIGYQMALSSNSKDLNVTPADPTVLATNEFAKLNKDVKDVGEMIGKKPVPYLTLAKLGWMF